MGLQGWVSSSEQGASGCPSLSWHITGGRTCCQGTGKESLLPEREAFLLQ